MNDQRRSLVTGANGFLGRALVGRLLANGERRLRLLVREGADIGPLEAVTAGAGDADIEYARADLTAPALDDAILDGVGVVYHLAAAMKGSAADMFMNSVVGTKRLLEKCRTARIDKFVLVSSFGVYGVKDLPHGAVVDERTPLETQPSARDLYSHSKHRQERLCWEYHERYGLPLVVVRPGVIYGPGGSPLSARVGLRMFGLFLHMGRGNLLPLSFVTNCAEAIVKAGQNGAVGEAYNVHDDDLPTCGEYLREYRHRVDRLRYVPVPYPVIMGISRAVERYHRFSRGQLPAVFTPYKTANLWKGTRFGNSKIKAIGWRQLVATSDGLAETFTWLRTNGAPR